MTPNLVKKLVLLWGKQLRLEEAANILTKIPTEDKALIFTRSIRLMAILVPYLEHYHKISVMQFDGTTSTSERAMIRRRLDQDPSKRFLLINIKCGGLGLNLQAANHVIFFDVWWRGM